MDFVIAQKHLVVQNSKSEVNPKLNDQILRVVLVLLFVILYFGHLLNLGFEFRISCFEFTSLLVLESVST